MSFIYYLAIFLFLILSSILCLVILVQESKSMGLGASFGGDAGESLFGTSTASVLKKFTGYLGVIFIVACIFLSIWSESMGKPKSVPLPSIEETQNLP
ncbi:MAG TPA: preprotein translocase subunit SecG [Rhabdochlamydiaceae bacterium]|nr:preprotein translocase subunit SecG [Rhabdochlamydiaceae bacterium]